MSSSCRKARRYERAELRARVDADPGRRHLLLCPARRLRPGRGHALQLHAGHPIAPVWDGNETWLVLGGVALLAAFPLAFAILIPALYFPILVMLLALVFRGVAFEFRFRDAEHKTFWDHGFFYGSLIATMAQGMMLGAFIQGFKVEGRVFAGGPLDFLTPFSVLTGIALVFGYGLLGAGWLVLKTEDDIQARARRYGRVCLAGVVISIVVVSLWTPLANDAVFRRWLLGPHGGHWVVRRSLAASSAPSACSRSPMSASPSASSR